VEYRAGSQSDRQPNEERMFQEFARRREQRQKSRGVSGERKYDEMHEEKNASTVAKTTDNGVGVEPGKSSSKKEVESRNAKRDKEMQEQAQGSRAGSAGVCGATEKTAGDGLQDDAWRRSKHSVKKERVNNIDYADGAAGGEKYR
jgi:hypothetical protein